MLSVSTAELRRGRTARSLAMPSYPRSTVAKEVTPGQRKLWRSFWQAGFAGDGEECLGGVTDSRRSSPRKKWRGERALGRRMRPAGARGGVVASKWRRWG